MANIVVFKSSFTTTSKNTVVIYSSGYYKIEAWGARGGGTSAAPTGAYSKSFVFLNSSSVLSVLVGEQGYDGYPNNQNTLKCGGGGGGSFVAEGSKPLCVAGGGGGFAAYLSSATSFAYSYGLSGEEGGDPGTGKGSIKQGGKGSPLHSGGGGGFEGDGENSVNGGGGFGGISFLNGGNRQTSGTNGNYGYGGFGGGGSNHGNWGYSGGGGGYTGGSSSYDQSKPSGGGGSFHCGSIKNEQSTSIAGYDSKKPTNPGEPNGYVIITFIGLAPNPSCKHFQHFNCSNGIPFPILKLFFILFIS